jgi:predicted GNAT family acetyltransferase
LSEITHIVSGNRGRYALARDGHEAELTWVERAPGIRDANHTGVPDAMRGTGAGLKLVERMVADARAVGFRILPSCPFVAAMAKRHKDWADVMV